MKEAQMLVEATGDTDVDKSVGPVAAVQRRLKSESPQTHDRPVDDLQIGVRDAEYEIAAATLGVKDPA